MFLLPALRCQPVLGRTLIRTARRLYLRIHLHHPVMTELVMRKHKFA
jgi:hypothetical protein